jgi:hypothetical protein
MYNENSPYKIIEGKYPKFPELMDWSETKWLNYLSYLDYFIYATENTEKWQVTSQKIDEMEVLGKKKDSPYAEFIWRTGQWSNLTTPQKYRLKINGMAMHTLGYLKKHPALITPAMEEQIKRHPQRMGWCLAQYKVEETLGGEGIVRRDVTVPADSISATRETSLPSIQSKILTAINKYADATELIAAGINMKDVKGMDIKDKLAFLNRAIPVLTQLGKAKTTPTHFTQINMNGSTKDIEKQMLEYTKIKDI